MVIALCLCSVAAMAQQSKRVEVTTIYVPEVSEATKLMVPTTISDEPVIEPEIRYSVQPETWQIELDAHKFRPATATYWDFTRAKRMFVRVGGGYPFNTMATVRYASQNTDVGYIGVGVDHVGDMMHRVGGDGVLRPMQQSFALNNSFDVRGGVYLAQRLFEACIDYDYDIYNRYAEVGEYASRLGFHDVGLNVRYGDDFVDLTHLNFSVEAHGEFWQHKPPMITDIQHMDMMYRAGGSVRLARMFSENVVGVDAGYDMWAEPHSGGYRDMRFWLGGSYKRSFGIVDIEAGLKYMYDNVRNRDKASHFVMPSAKVVVDLQRAAFAPYAELSTTVEQNSMMSLYRENPYTYNELFYHTSPLPNTRSYNLSVGFSGTALANRFAYRAYVGGNFMRDQLFWYLYDTGLFGFTTAANNRLFFGVEAEIQPVGGLIIDLGFHAHANNTRSAYCSSDPRMTADLRAEYTLKRWKFYAGAELIGRRRWSSAKDAAGKVTIAFDEPVKVDLRAGVSFRVSHLIEVYADGFNLLNSKIFDWAYYYRMGAGFNAGVKLNF